MIVIDIDPVLLYIGGNAIVRWYGVMFVVGILVATAVAIKIGSERGITEDDYWAVFWPATIAGLVGARLYYVAQSDPLSYLAQPWRILATWEGGLAFYGAIFGAVIAILVVCYRRRVNIWSVLDVGAIFAVVGQSFGRIGNIINGDVVGYPTTLPWGFIYAHPNSFVAERALALHGTMPFPFGLLSSGEAASQNTMAFPIGAISPEDAASLGAIAYQPAAIYELIFNILLFSFLWWVRGRIRRPGLLFVTWLVIYSLGQILIFTQRMNEVLYFGLKQAQLTAIVVIVACIPLLWYLFGRTSSDSETAGDPEDGDKPPEGSELPESGTSSGTTPGTS